MFNQTKVFEQIKRIALRYSPESPTDYRRDRLPPDADFADMALADGVHLGNTQSERAKAAAVVLLLFSPVGAVILVGLGAYIPLLVTLPVSVAISFAAVFVVLFRHTQNKRRAVIRALLIPPAVAIGFTLLPYRFWGSLFVAVLAAATLKARAKAPFILWQEALFNSLHVSDENRGKIPPIECKLDLVFLVLTMVPAILLPVWSPFWAVLYIAFFPPVFLWRRMRQAKSTDPAFRSQDIFALVSTMAEFPSAYRAQYRPYPGIWNPRDKLDRSDNAMRSMLMTTALFFAIALSCYSAWDAPFLKSRFLELFHGQLQGNVSHMNIIAELAPSMNWKELPPVYTPPPGAMTKEEFFLAREKMSDAQKKQGYKQFLAQYEQENKTNAVIGRFARSSLNASPCLWLYLSGISLANGSSAVILLWLFSLVLAVTVPPIVLITALFTPLRSALELQRSLEAKAEDEPGAQSNWRGYVERVRVSPHATRDPITSRTVREAEHLFMGHEPVKGFPVLLDRSILKQHSYILGGTGFGKTSLGIMPMLMQLIQGHRDERGAMTPMPPMLIIDLKGDKALFHTVRAEVERKAKEEGRSVTDAFRTFSCEIGHACHPFNPFDDLRQGTVELCNVYLDALNLNHGEGYGRSYYTMQSRSLLRQVLKNDKPTTFKELYDGLLKCKRSKAFREAYELVATIEALSDYEHIFNPARSDKAHVIHMPTVVRERQVVYFWLPAAEHSLTAKEIASLAVYAFYNAQREWVNSSERKTLSKSRPEAFLVIDEFQRVASRNFPNILREARSFGMGIILAHQSASDLELPDVDLAAIVRENTRLKLFFAIQNPSERRLFSELSGDEVALHSPVSYSFEGEVEEDKTGTAARGTTVSFSPVIKPRITKNDIIETSDHPFEYFMLVSQGAGYTQFGGYPIAVRTSYPLPTDAYEARSDQPWPDKNELGLPDSAPITSTPIEAADEKRLDTLAAIDAAIDGMFSDYPSLQY